MNPTPRQRIAALMLKIEALVDQDELRQAAQLADELATLLDDLAPYPTCDHRWQIKGVTNDCEARMHCLRCGREETQPCHQDSIP